MVSACFVPGSKSRAVYRGYLALSVTMLALNLL